MSHTTNTDSKLQTFTVIYQIEDEGIQWQFFECQADDSVHAEEQCMDAYPTAAILWVNEGTSQEMI